MAVAVIWHYWIGVVFFLLSLLVVTAGLFSLAASLGLLAVRRVKKGVPPIPEQALMEAKQTTEAVKANGSRRSG